MEFKFIKKQTNYCFILFFTLNALEMLLELVASRVMSPYFGTSTAVWTAIIGIILLSASIGNIFGGKISEKRTVPEVLFFILFISALFIALIPKLSITINPILTTLDIRLGALISSILLFLIPSIMISIITPFLIKSILDKTDLIGESSGKIQAIIAIGSLFGTFIGGFFLIPKIGTTHLLYLISLILFILMFISIPKKVEKSILISSIIFIIFTIVLMLIPVKEDLKKGVSIDTKYSRIIIQDTTYNNQPVRLYKSSGAYSSGMSLKDETELIFDYTKCYNDSFNYNPNIENTLMIGGAAYSYPKYWISHTDKKMTVVEIDPDAEKIARKYFKLTDVINKYDKNNERLTLLTDDGRIYLNNNKIKYDAIFNDAFSGGIPVTTLATREAVQCIYNSLTDDGIYMSNILGTAESEFILSEMNTIKSVFPYVYIYNSNKSQEKTYNNYIVVGSKKPLKNNSFLNVDYSKGLVLTDDYAPIEKMVGDSYFNH